MKWVNLYCAIFLHDATKKKEGWSGYSIRQSSFQHKNITDFKKNLLYNEKKVDLLKGHKFVSVYTADNKVLNDLKQKSTIRRERQIKNKIHS